MPWTRMRYRNGKIWAETDDQGALLVANGLASARYREDDTRDYSFKAAEIRHLDGSAPAQALRVGAAPAGGPPAAPHPAANGASASAGGGAKAPKAAASPKKPSVGALNDPTTPVAEMPPASEEFIEVYTDGATSGNPGPSGLGVILRWGPYHREIRQFLGQGTNNIAELTAIKVGLEAVKNRALPVRVYTDSQYSIGVLEGSYKAKANQALIEEIRALMRLFPRLSLHKVRGHAGDPLNERADELARLAITEKK
jgi:ribonuclease HI